MYVQSGNKTHGQKDRDYEIMENDMICILRWFYINQGDSISLNRCSGETGVSYPSLHKYITAPIVYGSTRWFLRDVGYKYGYIPMYVGKSRGWIRVNKTTPNVDVETVLDNNFEAVIDNYVIE